MARHSDPATVHWPKDDRANHHTLDSVRYDARFQRTREIYLAGSVTATRYSDSALGQFVVTNNHRQLLPLHRIGKT